MILPEGKVLSYGVRVVISLTKGGQLLNILVVRIIPAKTEFVNYNAIQPYNCL